MWRGDKKTGAPFAVGPMLLLCWLVSIGTAGCGAAGEVSTDAPVSSLSDIGEDGGHGSDSASSGDATTGADAAAEDAGEVDAVCLPLCDGLHCGPDGCGGSCGACGPEEVCNGGLCASAHDCDPKSCGRGACGEEFIDCAEGAIAGQPAICDESIGRCVVPTAECEDGWCHVPAGSFVMGERTSTSTEDFVQFSLPAHPVVLTRPFFIQQTEVTVAAYRELMGAEAAPAEFAACGPNCPMAGVTPGDVMTFANRLSERDGLPPCYTLPDCAAHERAAPGVGLECVWAGFAGPDCAGYRLPSEAEWEFAARAGTATCTPNGAQDESLLGCPEGSLLDQIAVYRCNADVDYEGCLGIENGRCIGPHPVATKEPNAFGLYDTSGNVEEMTGSPWQDYVEGLEVDPGYLDVLGGGLVCRGGSFPLSVHVCSSARHGGVSMGYPSVEASGVGFRLVRTDLP